MAKKVIDGVRTGNETPTVKRSGGAGQYDGVKGYPARSKTSTGPPERVIDGNVGGPKPPTKQSY